VVPNRAGSAILNAADVGTSPSVAVFRQGSYAFPSYVMIKKIGGDWKTFYPQFGHKNSQGNNVVFSQEKPHAYPAGYKDIMAEINRADKQWGIEFLGSLAGVQKA